MSVAAANEQLISLETPGGVTATVTALGAYVNSLAIDGQDLLLPRQTIIEADKAKDRGGMFPCLPNFGASEHFGLAQHGFGRETDFAVTVSTPDKAVLVHLYDEPSTAYDQLAATVAYRLGHREGQTSLHSSLTLHNGSTKAMAISPGFHPYFPTSLWRDGRPDEEVLMRTDYPTKTPEVYEQSFDSFRLAPLQQRAQRVGRGVARLTMATGNHQMVMDLQDGQLQDPIVWSGSPAYFCIEPTHGGSAFTSGQALPAPKTSMLMLQPDEEQRFSFALTWEPRE